MRFFVGTYTRMGGPGIVLCTLEKGAMHVLSVAPELENPTYVILSANRRRLYAVSSGAYAGEEGSVASYDLEGDQWMLRTRQGTAGKSPCHLTCSPDERFLYEANYLTGNLSVYPLTAAGIGPRIQCIQHEGKGLNPTRQECAHLHQATFTPGHPTQLQAVDLGIDAVVTYTQDPQTGLLTETARLSTVPGLGPRHLAYAKDGNTAYLAYELGNVVSVLRAQDAGWVCVQTLSTLPEQAQGESSVAAVRVTDTQVMVSNRGHDSIAVFERLPDGLLRRTHIAAVPGKFPRDFALLDDGRMLVAQQDAGGVAYLQWTGDRLTPCCAPLPIAGAVCVCLG